MISYSSLILSSSLFSESTLFSCFLIGFSYLFLVICQRGVQGYLDAYIVSNLLTVIAILGMLPASKSAVGMIMFLRFKTGERSIYDETIQAAKGLPMNYDLVLTTTQKAYQISSAACYANTLCGYVENPKTDCAALEKHISEMLNKNNFKNVTVKFFDDFHHIPPV